MRTQSKPSVKGFSLLEILIALLVLSLVVGAVTGVVVAFQKFYRRAQSQSTVQVQNHAIQRLLNEDVLNAGKGTHQDVSGGRTLVKTPSDNIAQPAVFVTEGGKNLLLIQTSPDETGVISFKGSSTLVVTGVIQANWIKLPAESVLVVLNQAGVPSLFKLSAVPRAATMLDFPSEAASQQYRVDRTVVLIGAVTADCGLVSALTDTIQTGALITPVNGFIKYYADPQNGLMREMYTNCSTQVAPENQLFVAPLVSKVSFAYVTTAGVSTDLPTDFTTLRGIQCQLSLNESGARVTSDVVLQVNVDEWQ